MQITSYSISARQETAACAVINAADADEGDRYEFHADGRDRDPSIAAPCADSDSRQRHFRRHRAGHTRARAALCASISRGQYSWLAPHDPDQFQPEPPPVASAATGLLVDQ